MPGLDLLLAFSDTNAIWKLWGVPNIASTNWVLLADGIKVGGDPAGIGSNYYCTNQVPFSTNVMCPPEFFFRASSTNLDEFPEDEATVEEWGIARRAQ